MTLTGKSVVSRPVPGSNVGSDAAVCQRRDDHDRVIQPTVDAKRRVQHATRKHAPKTSTLPRIANAANLKEECAPGGIDMQLLDRPTSAKSPANEQCTIVIGEVTFAVEPEHRTCRSLVDGDHRAAKNE
jgi:hypothetical protein